MQVPEKVSIEVFIKLVGRYSKAAIRKKIARGIWLKDREYEKAPDGGIFILMKGFYQWVSGT